ncbi:MAG: acetyl-CoA carboxylase biotin carboxyl carrier protein [Prochlorococcaceae cyanobacterium]|jgi:acetyl-CoA carboxylase biotin carboxyl carrier protein
MAIDPQELRSLLEFLSGSDIQELKLEVDDFRLEVRRNLPPVVSLPAVLPPTMTAVPPLAAPPETPAAAPPPAAAASRSDLLEIRAPMVGTFYRAPAPGDPPFVEIGSRITPGQPICILEAMKLMNELEADQGGELVEILVENGTPVEYDQVLMRLRPV